MTIVIYSKPLQGDVYSIDNDKIERRYFINMKDSPLPADYEQKTQGDYRVFMQEYIGKYNYYTGKLVENDAAVLFLTENKDRKRYWNVYSKESRRVRTGIIDHSRIGKLAANSMILFGLNNCLTYDGSDIIGYLDLPYLDAESFAVEYPVLEGLSADSNPVLFRFEFKEQI